MIFTTWTFALFFWTVLAIYWLLPSRRRVVFLAIASIFCYAWAVPEHALIIGALTLITYFSGRLILRSREQGGDGAKEKRIYLLGIGASLFALCTYKYAKMAAASVDSLLLALHLPARLPVPHLLIPLGISFFTFEFIHYLTDLYLGKIDRTDLAKFTLFGFFFPTMVSGPIKRFQVFSKQSGSDLHFDWGHFSYGMQRVVSGLFKKLVVADVASRYTVALTYPVGVSMRTTWIAMVAYAIKIYYDFSGYSDVAIGGSIMFGYHVPENFNMPYIRANISEFWRHWHMSLSSWIRDYLFIPLGGSRVPRWRMFLNFFLVMAICGLWHGANWNFVVWGLWHGAGLAGWRAYRGFVPNPPDNALVFAISWAATFLFVCIGWVMFAAPNMPTAIISLKHLVGR